MIADYAHQSSPMTWRSTATDYAQQPLDYLDPALRSRGAASRNDSGVDSRDGTVYSRHASGADRRDGTVYSRQASRADSHWQRTESASQGTVPASRGTATASRGFMSARQGTVSTSRETVFANQGQRGTQRTAGPHGVAQASLPPPLPEKNIGGRVFPSGQPDEERTAGAAGWSAGAGGQGPEDQTKDPTPAAGPVVASAMPAGLPKSFWSG
jgi:hypothetical protein